jgi:hypothetical protein
MMHEFAADASMCRAPPAPYEIAKPLPPLPAGPLICDRIQTGAAWRRYLALVKFKPHPMGQKTSLQNNLE